MHGDRLCDVDTGLLLAVGLVAFWGFGAWLTRDRERHVACPVCARVMTIKTQVGSDVSVDATCECGAKCRIKEVDGAWRVVAHRTKEQIEAELERWRAGEAERQFNRVELIGNTIKWAISIGFGLLLVALFRMCR